MGQDGLRGCEWIHDRGGRIVVQDEATSIVWGMPGAVSRAGLADAVVPLDRMAPAIEGALAITPPAIDTKILNHVASACV
jgi:two-component system chemotaxis response regulator CheB